MKILYAIQATGNGHISRALEIMPYLKHHGDVDIFLSGSNSALDLEYEVKYRDKGISFFFNRTGGLDYTKTIANLSLRRIYKSARELPVEKYDIILNDFERITHLACKNKGKNYIHFGHQASFISEHTPRPIHRNLLGEIILKHFAKSDYNVGLHFDSYDKDIYNPVIKNAILNAKPIDRGHITVYLNQYSTNFLINIFASLTDVCFHIFSDQIDKTTRIGNIILFPIQRGLFEKSMIESKGVITGAGFETPAEAMYLGKKLMCIPVKGQYEQLCNAVALKRMNVPVFYDIGILFALDVMRWLNSPSSYHFNLNHTTNDLVNLAIQMGLVASKTAPESLHLDETVLTKINTLQSPSASI